jgi:hypothetical protein
MLPLLLVMMMLLYVLDVTFVSDVGVDDSVMLLTPMRMFVVSALLLLWLLVVAGICVAMAYGGCSMIQVFFWINQ